MNKLEALKYLSLNGHKSSEWQEAGLLAALEWVLHRPDAETFEKFKLDDMIEDASNN